MPFLTTDAHDSTEFFWDVAASCANAIIEPCLENPISALFCRGPAQSLVVPREIRFEDITD